MNKHSQWNKYCGDLTYVLVYCIRSNSEREVVAGVAPGFAQRGYMAGQGGYKTG